MGKRKQRSHCPKKECNPAVVSRKQILQKCHDLAQSHYDLGCIYRDKKDYDEATTHFEMALTCEDTFIAARYEVMLILRDVDEDPKQALAQAQIIWNVDRQWMAPEFMTKLVPDLVKAVEAKKANTVRTPVTILTGFLGSGKTTLLNRILAENHGHKIAVIENEYGAVGIDEKLVVMNDKLEGDAIIEIMNGCICCTVREDLATTLQEMKEKYVDTGKIDYIILETTGMADPGPVISTFLIHPDIQEWAYVDACITVCDATQIIDQLNDDREEGCENEAVEQVCFADKVLLNKIDLVDEEKIEADIAKIRQYNTHVNISNVQLTNREIPFDELLNQKAFEIERCLDMDPTLVAQDAFEDHKHDSRIGTFSWKLDAEMTEDSGTHFLHSIAQEEGANIYRMKGFLAIEGLDEKFLFHSVGMICDIEPMEKWAPGEKRECLIVIIGKHLNKAWLEDKIREACTTVPKELGEIEHPQGALNAKKAQDEEEKMQVEDDDEDSDEDYDSEEDDEESDEEVEQDSKA